MISYPQLFPALSTGSHSLLHMGLRKHTLHTMQETSGEGLKLAGLPPLPMQELREIFLAQLLCPLVETLEQVLPFDHQARPRDGVPTMYSAMVVQA